MSPLLLAFLAGFVGGLIAVAVLAIYLRSRMGKADSIIISKGPGPELYKEVEVLEYVLRPHGLYVRFKNVGTKPIEMAHFKVRGFKEGKLWAEFEESAYLESQPGKEQEAILKLSDYRDGLKTFDLKGCKIEVNCLYGYVLTVKAG